MVTSAEPHDGKTIFQPIYLVFMVCQIKKCCLLTWTCVNQSIKLFELSITKGLVDYLINNASSAKL